MEKYARSRLVPWGLGGAEQPPKSPDTSVNILPSVLETEDHVSVEGNQTMTLSTSSVIHWAYDDIHMCSYNLTSLCTWVCPPVWLASAHGLNMYWPHQALVLSTQSLAGGAVRGRSAWRELGRVYHVVPSFLSTSCPPRDEHSSSQALTAVFCLTSGPGLMEPKTMNWNLQDYEPK